MSEIYIYMIFCETSLTNKLFVTLYSTSKPNITASLLVFDVFTSFAWPSGVYSFDIKCAQQIEHCQSLCHDENQSKIYLGVVLR